MTHGPPASRPRLEGRTDHDPPPSDLEPAEGGGRPAARRLPGDGGHDGPLQVARRPRARREVLRPGSRVYYGGAYSSSNFYRPGAYYGTNPNGYNPGPVGPGPVHDWSTGRQVRLANPDAPPSR
ncbi:MAG: hypothetical protein WKF75_09520 [Singulisphaera sp.]